MSGKETFMIETLTREMIVRSMEEHSLSMRDVMDIVYKSKTFSALNNTNCFTLQKYEKSLKQGRKLRF